MSKRRFRAETSASRGGSWEWGGWLGWSLLIATVSAIIGVTSLHVWSHRAYESLAASELARGQVEGTAEAHAARFLLPKELAQRVVEASEEHRFLAAEIHRLERELANEHTARSVDRVNFLTRSGDEWRQNPRFAVELLTLASAIAHESKLDAVPIETRLKGLGVPRPLPADTRLRLVSIRREPPGIVVEFRAESSAGAFVSGLRPIDILVESGDATPVRHVALAEGTAQLTGHQVAMLLDLSSSMEGAPLASAVSALGQLATHVTRGSRARLYTFGDQVRARTPWTSDAVLIHEELRSAKANGGTPLLETLTLAQRELAERPGARTIIVCTDGRPTREDATTINSLIAACKASQTTIQAVGIASADLDSSLLRRLAVETGGEFLLATKPEECAAQMRTIEARLSGSIYRLVVLDPEAHIKSLRLRVQEESLAVAVDNPPANATSVSQVR